MICCSPAGKVARSISSLNPMGCNGPCADFGEKHEPRATSPLTMDSLKALDPNRPIREVDMPRRSLSVGGAGMSIGSKRKL